MTLQPVTYCGRLVACATPRRFFLCDELDRRPAGDPERTFVMFMCAYASRILRRELPASYTDERARVYARAALIPEELLERDRIDVQHTAAALGVPVCELAQARATSRRGAVAWR